MRETYLWFRQLELRLSNTIRTLVETGTENRVRPAAASLQSVAGVRVFTDIVTVSSPNQHCRSRRSGQQGDCTQVLRHTASGQPQGTQPGVAVTAVLWK